MRRNTALPEIPAITPWARAAVKAMKHIRLYGYASWLENETTAPTLDDPDWTAFVAHERGEGPAPRFHELPEDLVHVQTYRCARCRDRDFELQLDAEGRLNARRCEACRQRRDAQIREEGQAGDQAPAFEERRVEPRRAEDASWWDQ